MRVHICSSCQGASHLDVDALVIEDGVRGLEGPRVLLASASLGLLSTSTLHGSATRIACPWRLELLSATRIWNT